MSIIEELKNLDNWNKISDGLFTFYVDAISHYEMLVTSYNHHEPYVTNAIGYLLYVGKEMYGEETLFFRIKISGEKSVAELLNDAATDYVKYLESENF